MSSFNGNFVLLDDSESVGVVDILKAKCQAKGLYEETAQQKKKK